MLDGFLRSRKMSCWHMQIFKSKVSQSIRQTWQFLQLKQSLDNYSDQTLENTDNMN